MKKILLRQLFMLSKRVLYAFAFQLFFVSWLMANDGNAQRKSIEEVRVTVIQTSGNLSQLFEKIEKQSRFKFSYNSAMVDLNQEVKLEIRKESIYDVLSQLMPMTGLSFIQVNETIHVRSGEGNNVSVAIGEASQLISGVVTDALGEPIPGVTIVVKGSTQGTVTDVDGKYTLDVSEGQVLVFSFVGYRSKEWVVGNQTTVDVRLEEDTQALGEVVVVGYGEIQKASLTGAVSTVNFGEDLNNRPITNASQALGGTVSGVWVSQNSGQPGNDGAQLRVRGWGTLNNSNPLVIVDGVEGNFNQINPNDIESITVLKDAASAAIYGSKAANGVILITTKSGETDQKMQVSLNSYLGTQSLGRRYDVISNSAEHMEMWNQAMINGGGSAVYPDYMIQNFRNSTDPFQYPNTNFYEQFFENAPIQEHNLSIRGGSEKVTSFISFNYLNQDGITPKVDSKRYGIRANITSKVNDWFHVSGRFNYQKRKTRNPYTYTELWQDLTTAPPYIAPFTRDGRFGASQAITEEGAFLFDTRNPFIDAANGRTLNDDDVLSINVAADVTFSPSLTWKTTLSTQGEWRLTDKYNTTVYGYTDNGDPVLNFGYNRGGIEISRNQVSRSLNNMFSTLNFKKEIGEKHDVSAILGLQAESLLVRSMYARRSNPPKEGLTQVNAGTDGVEGNGAMNGLHMFSYFGRVNYAFLDKYLFEANLRADASSRFADGNRWGVFPGLSAGWRVSDEEFLRGSALVSNLKLRASWGQLGNQNISDYWPYLTVIDQTNALSYTYADNFAPGAAVTGLVDETITWETSTTLDIGADLGLFENRLNLELDYFKKVTSDIIVQLPIPSLLGGLTPPYENVGEMVNQGFELSANFQKQAIDPRDFSYTVGLNFTYIDNEVTKFRGGESPDQLYLIREGYSYRTLYGYKAIGIYQSDAEAAEHMFANSFTPKAGNIKIEDLNADGRLDYQDQQELGNTIPKFTYGLNSQLSYKGFDLNILLQGIGKVNAFTRSYQTNLTSNVGVISTKWRDAWTPDNSDSQVPSLKFDDSWDNSNNSYWVQDISYIKLKNIQLGYDLPQHLVSRIGVEKLYFYANAQNVFTIVSQDYEGFDPERNTFDNGQDMYPIPRIFSLGLNLNF